MSTSNSNNILSLNCIIPGDEFEDIFTLEISEDKLVNQLKPMIRKWWPNRFQHIDPSKLILYKVLDMNIALGLIEPLKKEKEGNKNYGQRLHPLDKICIHFNNDKETYPDSIKPKENRVTAKLIEFLQEQGLGLSETTIKILEKEEVEGQDFFDLTEEKFRSVGLGLGPASRLAKFAKECKDKKLRAFSTYRSLKEVLKKYGIGGNGTDTIPLFSLQTHEIQDSNKHLKHCVENILFRMKHYGSLVQDSLESMRNEYVSTILHTALHIAEDTTEKEFSMRPEYEIIGEESCGRVDYAIKEKESLICVTEDKVQRSILEGFAQNIKQLESSYETNRSGKRKREDDDFDYLYGIVTSARDWHFLLYSPGEISQASELPLAIEFNKKALVKDSEEYKKLHDDVKNVLEMVVGMVIDRACAEEEPDRKRARIEGYRSKK